MRPARWSATPATDNAQALVVMALEAAAEALGDPTDPPEDGRGVALHILRSILHANATGASTLLDDYIAAAARGVRFVD